MLYIGVFENFFFPLLKAKKKKILYYKKISTHCNYYFGAIPFDFYIIDPIQYKQCKIQTLTEGGVRDRLRGQCQRCPPGLPHSILLKACRNSGENIVYITGFNVLLK